jgi:hypothetical protein
LSSLGIWGRSESLSGVGFLRLGSEAACSRRVGAVWTELGQYATRIGSLQPSPNGAHAPAANRFASCGRNFQKTYPCEGVSRKGGWRGGYSVHDLLSNFHLEAVLAGVRQDNSKFRMPPMFGGEIHNFGAIIKKFPGKRNICETKVTIISNLRPLALRSGKRRECAAEITQRAFLWFEISFSTRGNR